MSYTLSVQLKGLSDSLIPEWISEISKFNMDVEVRPDFSFHGHEGYLPFKIVLYDCPNRSLNHRVWKSGFELHVRQLEEKSKKIPFLAKLFGGREQQQSPLEQKLSEADTEVSFQISARDSFEFRMGWYAAASLALVGGGVLTDPQDDEQLEGQQLIRHALETVLEDEGIMKDDEWQVREFRGW